MTHLPAVRYYPGQFATTPDLLHVAIPQIEIVSQMVEHGEHEALNSVCLSVAVVADALTAAQTFTIN